MNWHQSVEVDYGTMEYFIDLNKEMISVVLKIFNQWAHTKKRYQIQLYLYKLCSTKHYNMLFSGNHFLNIHSTQRFLLYKIQIIWIQFTQNSLSTARTFALNFPVFSSIRDSWTRRNEITYWYKAILALPKVFRLPRRQVGGKS